MELATSSVAKQQLREALLRTREMGLAHIKYLGAAYRDEQLIGVCILMSICLPLPKKYATTQAYDYGKAAAEALHITRTQACLIRMAWDGWGDGAGEWQRIGAELRDEFKPMAECALREDVQRRSR